MSAFPRVFGGHFRVIPTDILEKVDKLLDEQIALVPDAAKDRETLKSSILDYVDEHGVIPQFSIERRPEEDIAADLLRENAERFLDEMAAPTTVSPQAPVAPDSEATGK
mgnify:CR=1 FL=1|jgi:hypothetical protein